MPWSLPSVQYTPPKWRTDRVRTPKNETIVDLPAANANHATAFAPWFDDIREGQTPVAVVAPYSDLPVLPDHARDYDEPGRRHSAHWPQIAEWVDETTMNSMTLRGYC